MTVDELKEAGKALYGYGWQTALASSLGIDGSTVRRWIGSGVGIPAPASAAIRCMASNARMRATLLALHLPDKDDPAAFRIIHRSHIEKEAFRAAVRDRGYQAIDTGDRSMESIVCPMGMQTEEAVAVLTIDDDGSVHRS